MLLPAVTLLLVGASAASASAPATNYQNGVNLGGWQLAETAWMFDRFSAPAEADWVASLRAQGGDAFAVSTLRNHWQHYYPDAALDAMAALGVTHARIPVGFWIVEAPTVAVPQPDDGAMRARRRAGPPGAYAFGFQHEGFATGGLNYLEELLAKLKTRGIKALVDLHALPGGASSCAGYAGWQVNQPLFWRGTPPASNATPVAGACGGAGPYRTTRGASKTWMAVGEEALLALGAGVVGLQAEPALADVVVALEAANEPGLGFDGVQPDIERFLASVVPQLQAAFAAGGVGASVAVNFIGPNDRGAGAWLAAQIAAGTFDGTKLLLDFHEYYNWDGSESWSQLAAKICGTTSTSSEWAQYTAAGLSTVIGEWSCSTNLGAKAFTDLSDPAVVAHLQTLYANQMSLFAASGGTAPGAAGQFHWTMRMGSGWDPRPTAKAPNGTQAAGSAWNKSLPDFGAAVWNLGELVRVGVAQPLSALNISGVCHCSGCNVDG